MYHRLITNSLSVSRMILISGYLLVLAASGAHGDEGDILWTRAYGGTGVDSAASVEQTSDGGYLLTGSTDSYGNGGFDFYLVKTDESGNQMGMLGFGGPGNEFACSGQQTPDNGMIIAGSTDSYGAGSTDFYLVKTRPSGYMEWARTYGGPDSESPRSLQQTSDEGYVIAGHTYSFGAGNSDFYLVKVDFFGNMEWETTYGGTGDDVAASVQQTADGGFIVAGYSSSFGTGDRDIYLVKTDGSGNVTWMQVYDAAGNEEAHSVQQTLDGGYIIAGQTDALGAGGNDFYLIKTDSFGNELWSRTYGGAADDAAHSVLQTFREGYLITGCTDSFGAGDSDFYLIKTDGNGNELWTQTSGDTGVEAAFSVAQNSDGNYVAAGFTQPAGSNDQDIMMVMLSGESPVSLSVWLDDPPAVVPSTGGVFFVSGSATNHTYDNLLLEAWAMVSVPGFGTMGPFHMMRVLVPAKSTIYRYAIPGVVPGCAPSGVYTVWPHIGDYPYVTYDTDTFEFQKLP